MQSDFRPDRERAQEVGNKWELFDKHLLATAALFRTNVEQRPRVGDGTRAHHPAGAAYHVQGIDLGATGKITDKWSIYTGLVLMKTRVDNSAVPSNIGLPLAFVANQSFNVLTKYKLTDSTSKSAARRPIARRSTAARCWRPIRARCCPTIGASTAFVEGKFIKNWKWKMFANNMFNKLYYDAFYQSAAPFVLVAPGRVRRRRS